MIEIVKKGIIKHRATCTKCTCEFLYTADEVTEDTVWDGDDHGGHYSAAAFLFYIKCPFCGCNVYVDERKFTEEELATTKKKIN